LTGASHQSFKREFARRGVFLLYQKFRDVESGWTSDILNGVRLNKKRAMVCIPGKGLDGRRETRWKFDVSVTPRERRFVRRMLRQTMQGTAINYNYHGKKIQGQTGQAVHLFQLSLFDDEPPALPGPGATS
jgi:hypothetical protein